MAIATPMVVCGASPSNPLVADRLTEIGKGSETTDDG
jgi:hypothetical protein